MKQSSFTNSSKRMLTFRTRLQIKIVTLMNLQEILSEFIEVKEEYIETSLTKKLSFTDGLCQPVLDTGKTYKPS